MFLGTLRTMGETVVSTGCSGNMSQRRQHLHKSHGIVAANASIPSKFQTIVVKNSEKKGFSSQTKRFTHEGNLTDVPGPGAYKPSSPVIKDRPSFSKKGYGGFVSKVVRFPSFKEKHRTVGPGQYDPVVRNEHYFNKSTCTSNFHQPIAVKRDLMSKNGQTPAPNQYQIPERVTGRVSYENSGGAIASFKSKTKRELLLTNEVKKTPAPCAYNIKDAAILTAPRGITAPFKSTTLRKMTCSPSANPGPGTYHPFETVEIPDRKKLPRKHYLCISAPAIPLPPSPPVPGPGHYNLVDYVGDHKRYVSSSMFVSSTNRWQGETSVEMLRNPGPATYNPRDVGKQSFIYNPDKKWI